MEIRKNTIQLKEMLKVMEKKRLKKKYINVMFDITLIILLSSRYLSTGSRVRSWYTSDPWTVGTPAYNDVRAVRRMHAMVRKKIRDMSNDAYNEKTKIKDAWCPALSRSRRDLESTCPAPKPGQCPYRAMGSIPDTKNQKLSQGEMSATQFAFVGLVILHPKFFGMHDATDEDLENFCYVWRGLGYLLGVDDE